MKKLLLFFGMVLTGAVNAQTRAVNPVYYFNPGWSPDGKQVVFESTRDGKYAIYTIQADGSGLRKLTSGKADDEQPRWSKDGRQIVFISNRDGHSQLYLMNADGSRQQRVTNGSDEDYIPDLSPKGDQIIFVAGEQTFIIRTDGAERRRLSDGGDNLRWSPDGKKILFTKSDSIPEDVRDGMAKMSREERLKVIAKRDGSAEIFIMNRDGSAPRNLTNNNTRDFGAEWSQDGKTIYFLSERDGPLSVYAMNASGSSVRKIADGNIVSQTNISPDEKYFVYAKQVNGKYGLYIYDIKSRKERLLIGG